MSLWPREVEQKQRHGHDRFLIKLLVLRLYEATRVLLQTSSYTYLLLQFQWLLPWVLVAACNAVDTCISSLVNTLFLFVEIPIYVLVFTLRITLIT